MDNGQLETRHSLIGNGQPSNDISNKYIFTEKTIVTINNHNQFKQNYCFFVSILQSYTIINLLYLITAIHSGIYTRYMIPGEIHLFNLING